MDTPFSSALHPALLPLGTVVGNWRVEAWAGRGVYGAVYRAVPARDEHAPPVALKLGLFPGDPRFAREVNLLSRFEHPSIPRLFDHGAWQAPDGALHPFIVMQWVDGVPLYDQARLRSLEPTEVLRWLAQLADALAALHAQGVIHRDVKGGNVLVRRSDRRAVLMDFGTGIYPGAVTLTPPMWFPGTPAYRSPESWLFELQFHREATARYRSSPADDLYALGVTACSLLTGEYPELAAPSQDEQGMWRLEAVIPPPALVSSLYVEPRLRDVTLRLLSVQPEQRGTAAQWAEALEQAAGIVVPKIPPSNSALQHPQPMPVLAEESVGAPASQALEKAQPQKWRGWPWLALAAGLAVAIWAWPDTRGEPQEEPGLACADASEDGSPDAGTRGLGELAAATSMEQPPAPSFQEKLAEEPLPEPQPGQTRPNAKGQCPHKGQIALNKGCWLEATSLDREGCVASNGQMFMGRCYVPIIPPGRRPTSSPTDKPQ